MEATEKPTTVNQGPALSMGIRAMLISTPSQALCQVPVASMPLL